MRIGIDARFAGPEGTGLGRYVTELVANLEKLDEENRYVIFLRKNNFDQVFLTNNNFEKALADVSWYGLEEQIRLPYIFSSHNLDLLHVPHFNVPVFYPGKFIVTIHDLIKSEFAGLSSTTRLPFIYFFKHLGYEVVIRIATSRAKKILVPSESISKKLQNTLSVPKEKIVVTYEAASLTDSKWKQSFSASQRKMQNAKSVLEKYQIKKPYLLYVGNAYPYKNLERLFLALKKLPKNLSFVNPCSRSAFYDRLGEKADELGLSERVILPGYVPDDDLVVLYKEAEAYVFPSLSEGFGMPGLDALSCGTPLICSAIPTLKEVYGDAAWYFDPYSDDDMTQKIKEVLKDKNLRETLIRKGRERMQKYSFLKMAKETLAVYNTL